jgi:hypothetical protein
MRLSILLLLISLLLPVNSLAQEALPLHISPVRTQLRLNQGESSSFIIAVTNNASTPVSGRVKVVDFLVQDKSGRPTLYETPSALSTRFSASSWTRVTPEELTIPPKEKAELIATLTVPIHALAGERYAAILFEDNATDVESTVQNTTNVSIIGRVGSIVSVRINGETKENLIITKFDIPWMSEHGPIQLTAEILNRSTVSISPLAAVQLTDLFGRHVETDTLEPYSIFPEATREYKTTLGHKWMIGRFKVDIDASYGEQGQTVSRSLYVWVLPWKVIITLLLLLLILYLGIRSYFKAKITDF